MAYINVNLRAIADNANYLLKLTRESGVEMAAVTKVVCGDPVIVDTVLEMGVKEIGESRLENIARIKKAGLDPRFLLLRLPPEQRFPEVIELADTALVGELGSLRELKELVDDIGKKTDFIYMVDTGDLREGVMYYDAFEELKEAVRIAGRNLVGIGTNLGCFGGVLAKPEKFDILLDLGRKIERETGTVFAVYSAGNTASLPLIENDMLPEGINHYRLGESIMCGTDVTNNRSVPGVSRDTFTIYGSVLELREKPSVPIGDIGQDAFGRKPVFQDSGIRLKAILDMGEQDVVPSGLKPLFPDCEVIHGSSDHLIVDITDYSGELSVGDSIPFRLSYGALLRAMTSWYVRKEYVV